MRKEKVLGILACLLYVGMILTFLILGVISGLHSIVLSIALSITLSIKPFVEELFMTILIIMILILALQIAAPRLDVSEFLQIIKYNKVKLAASITLILYVPLVFVHVYKTRGPTVALLTFLGGIPFPLLLHRPNPMRIKSEGLYLDLYVRLFCIGALVITMFSLSLFPLAALIMADLNIALKMLILSLYISILAWLSYKLFSLLMARAPRSDVNKLLKESYKVDLGLAPLEIRIANVGSPIALKWHGKGSIFVPIYMLPLWPKRLSLSSDELRAILKHEAIHIDLDGEARWGEVKRNEELKSLYLACVWSIVAIPVFALILFVSGMLFVALTEPWAFVPLTQELAIETLGMIPQFFAETEAINLLVLCSVAIPIMTFFTLTGDEIAVRFREARADFMAVLKTRNLETYKSALLRVYEMARKFSSPSKLSGSLLALCFAPPEGLDEGVLARRPEDLSLGRITRTRLKDVLWFPKNVHPSLPERLFVVDVAGALLSDGLRVEFRRPLKEGDYWRLAPSRADLPRIKCLLRSIQDICERKGRLKLCELEEAMSREGFKLSYAELFGALVFLDSRGMAAVRP